MTREQLNNLFEKEYVRYNLKHNKSIEGSGLGLNIVYSFVDLMKGNIKVKSKPQKGSTFTLRIPQKIAGDALIGAETAGRMQNFEFVKTSGEKPNTIKHTPMPYGSVLVVDDAESNLYVAKGLLARYKLKVETADSGYASLELVNGGNKYDIIFMDHMMPDMDGVETTRQLLALGYEDPIVVLTANIVMAQEEVYSKAGFAGYISKPIDTNVLDKTLMRLIHDKQPPDVLAAAAQNNEPEIVEDSNAVSAELVASFLRDATKAIETLNNVIGREDISGGQVKMYTISTHAMKSALFNINETELSSLAGTLEDAGHKNDTAVIKAKTPHFLELLVEVVKKLSPEEDLSIEDEDPAYLKEQLRVIHDASTAYNKKVIKKALTNLGKKTWSKKTNDIISEIKGHLLHSEFELIAKAVDMKLKNGAV